MDSRGYEEPNPVPDVTHPSDDEVMRLLEKHLDEHDEVFRRLDDDGNG